MHAAITFIEVGRGLGRVKYPVLDLGQVGKKATTWHILDPNTPICGTRGYVRKKATQRDCTTIVFDGSPVCARCRSLLGPVPETTYVREAI